MKTVAALIAARSRPYTVSVGTPKDTWSSDLMHPVYAALTAPNARRPSLEVALVRLAVVVTPFALVAAAVARAL